MTKIQGGPEQPTLVELWIGLLPLPYALGCVVMVVLSFFGLQLLEVYLETSDLSKVSAVFPLQQLPFVLAIFWLALYLPHFMRGRLLLAEESIRDLLPRGEEDFHKLFRKVSDLRIQLILLALIAVGQFLLTRGVASSSASGITVAFDAISDTLFGLVLASIIPLYIFILWGIHRMGSVDLRFQPYYKDRLLGLKPVGSLALALFAGYFTFISVGLIIPTILAGQLNLGVAVANMILALLGVLLFFLPLVRLHGLMVQQKRLEKQKLDVGLAQVFGSSGKADSPNELAYMFKLDLMRREISSIAVWPLDTSILSKLVIIILSVTAALLAKAIGSILKI